MKIYKTILCLVIFLGGQSAFGCCETIHFFDIIDVSSKDVLNIRKHPHHQADKVAAISSGAKGKVSMIESSAVINFECLGKPVNDTKLIDELMKAEDFEGHRLYKTIRPMMTGVPKNKGAKNAWCRITYEGTTGWVNARYLKHRCSREIGDGESRPTGC